MKKLILIDALSLLYRAFYAIRELSTDDGRPTNAVYGFIRKVRAIRKTHGPSHWAVVFDGGLPQGRIDLLKDYKAQRPEMPPALREQFPAVEQYLDAAGMARFRVDGEEADDVMATIAKAAESEADEVLLASSDKDLFQLVSPKTRILTLSGAGEILDGRAVTHKTGVAPDRIVDWLALVGDTVDNIPGVPGIGPKTAANLLTAFGSLAGIRARIEEVAPLKRRAALANAADLLERNVALIRLRSDLAVEWTWDKLETREPDPAKLLNLFEALEFRNMVREIREPELF